MRLAFAIAALAALVACKKETPPPEQPPPRAPAQLRVPARGRETQPPLLDPAKHVPGRMPRRVHPSVERAVQRARLGPSLRIGEGTFTGTLDQTPMTLPLVALRRGVFYVLAGERADLGLVITLPGIDAGAYAARPDAGAQPSLRVRVGPRAAAHLYLSSDIEAADLAVQIRESTASVVRGEVRGQVGRDGGKERKALAGTFEVRITPPPPIR